MPRVPTLLPRAQGSDVSEKKDGKDKGWMFEIRHYRSNSDHGSKGVVVERVVPGSDTARFFERMEKRRLAKACSQVLDLRGRVNAECKRYVYKMESHYMDEASYQTFREGLRQNGGVFTVGTFEAIVGASHVKKISAPPPKPKPKPPVKTQPPAPTPAAPAERSRDTAQAAPPGQTTAAPVAAPQKDGYFDRANPQIIPFGYYRKRKDPRLLYTTAAAVALGDTSVDARTRDISVGGILLALAQDDTALAEGQQVSVGFPDLQTLENGACCAAVGYKIARVETKDSEKLATLIRIDRSAEPEFNAFLEAFIAAQSAKHKLDPEDEICTATALAHQRYYSAALTHLPLFFRVNDSGAPMLHSIGINDHNSALLDIFLQDDGSVDLSALRIPERVRRLCMEVAFRPLQQHADEGANAPDSDVLLIVFKDKSGQVHSVADFELGHPEDKIRLLRHALLHPDYRFFRVGMSLVREHDMAKMEALSSQLQRKAADEASALRKEVRGIFALGTLADMTATLTQELRAGAPMVEPVYRLDGLYAFRGAARVALGPPKPGDQPTTATLLPEPKRIPFGFHAERREDRFLAKTKVEMEFNGQRTPGLTRDVSTRGACIMLEQAPPVRPGDRVTVGFLSFTKKNYGCDIRSIPYRVARVERDTMFYVMLEREQNPEWDKVTEFFNEIIEINRQKLGVCMTDVQSMATARLHEEALAAHLISTPLFLGKDDKGRLTVQRVGVSEYSPQLADYFYVGPQHIDYRALNERDLLNHLSEALKKTGKAKGAPAPVQCDLILYKETDAESGATAIRCVADFQLATSQERAQLIDHVIAGGAYRFMRLFLTNRSDAVRREVESYVEAARAASRHRATKLEQELANITAVGDLVDVTREVVATHQAVSRRS